jgi:hypothetical protein
MKSKCINPNNNIILELAEKLGKSKYETAIDVEIWQENNNTSKIPSAADLSLSVNTSLLPQEVINQTESWMNESYAKNLADKLTAKYPNYSFEAYKSMRIGGLQDISWRVKIGNGVINRVFKGEKEITASKVLSNIAKSNHPLNKLAQHLGKFVVNNDITLTRKNEIPVTNGISPTGIYYSDTNKIEISEQQNHVSPEVTVLHEILHHLTFNYLRKNTAENDEFLSFYNEAKKNTDIFPPYDAKTNTGTYALNDVDEFMVALFTDSRFIKKLKEIPATKKSKFSNLFQEIFDYILGLFGVTKNSSLYSEAFAVATHIISGNQTETDTDYEFSFPKTLGNIASNVQNEIINQLDNLQDKVTKENEQYQIEGFTQEWIRASTVAKKKIQKRSFAPLTEAEEEKSNMYTQAGTVIHAIQANYIKKMFPEANKHLADTVIPIELKDLELAIEEQLKPYVDAAKARGSVLRAEAFVANVDSKIAGTIDLLEITKEGNYLIYDLKTRFTKDETAQRRFNKIGEWSDQTIEYKKPLEKGDKALGIIPGEVEGVFILELEVLPVNNGVVVSSKSSVKGNLSVEARATKFLKYRKLNKIKVVAPFFLRTKDIKLDLMIDSLMAQIEKIKALKPKTDIEKEAKEALFNSKIELMQSLQLKKDINKLIESAYNDLTQIEKLIEDRNLGENTQVVKEQLELYSNILKYIDYNNLDKVLLDKLKNVQLLASKLSEDYFDLNKETIIKTANSNPGLAETLKNFSIDLFGAVKDIGVFRKLTMGISTVDNPLIQNAYQAVRNALAKSRSKAQTLANKVIEARKKLVEQLGKADFNMMINYNSDGEPVLVQEFSYEFYKQKKAADRMNDDEWLNENVTYDQQHYLEAREKQLDYLDAYRNANRKKIAYQNPELTPTELDAAVAQYNKVSMQLWESKNKGSLIEHFTPKVKWRDPKWVDIKMGKYKGTAVEEFYDLYYTTLELARELQPNDVHKNFIPNFAKSFIDRTMQNGLTGAIQGKWSGLFDSLELDFDREAYSTTDSVTGEIIHTMYIPGTSKQNAKEKSTDLAASLFMFMEGVYRFEELKDVEQMVLATKKHLKYNSEFVKKDALGRVIEGAKSTVNVNSNSSEMFDSWVDGTLYGIKTKNETAFELKGNGFTQLLGLLKKGETKKISYAKIIDKILGYTSLRNLGFNMYAPIVNLLSGSANMYMTGAGGVHYNSENMTKALGLVLGGKTNFPNADVEKARLIVDWLGVDTSEFKKNVEEELSSYKTKRLLAKYNLLSIMNLSEGVLRDSGAIAMVLSGKHKYKWEDFTVVDGKLVVNTDLLTKEVFRQKVIAVNQSNIGGINPDDMMMAKQYITGRILMQHRSWLPALFFNRFGGKQFDYNLGKDIEGRYLTAFRLFKHLTFQKNIKELSEMEQANLKAARIEVAMILGTGLLLAFMKAGFDDDDKKEAWYKVTKKINSRVFSELIFFADPTFQNQYQILLSPAASAGTIEDVGKFLGASFTEIVETDPKKLEKNKPGTKALKLIPGSKVYTFIEDLATDEK